MQNERGAAEKRAQNGEKFCRRFTER